MRRFDRYQIFTVTLAVIIIVAAMVFASLRQALVGFAPEGLDPSVSLATIDVQASPGRSPGIPLRMIDALHTMPGVTAAYASRSTRFFVATTRLRKEVGAAFVTHEFFNALQVPVHGPGFSHRHDRERIGMRECIVSAAFAAELGSAAAVTGSVLQVDDQDCTVVGAVANAFAGLRVQRRQDLWLSWPSAVGLTLPAVAPDAFIERIQLASEAGAVLDGTRTLSAVTRDVGAQAAAMGVAGHVTLASGEGLGARQRQEALGHVSLLWLATVDFLAIGSVFLIAMAVWRAQRRAAEFSVRAALGASAHRLRRAALADACSPLLVALCIALPLGCGSYRLLVQWPMFDAVRSVLPPWPTAAGMAFACSSIGLVGGVSAVIAMLGARAATPRARAGLPSNMTSLRRPPAIERVTVFGIVSLAVFSICLALSLWQEQSLRQQRDMGYSRSDATVFSLTQAASIEQSQQYLPPDASPRALKRELESLFGAGRVALAASAPMRSVRNTWPVLAWQMTDTEMAAQVHVNLVDADFFGLLGLAFIEGSGFTSDVDDVVLSRRAAHEFVGPPPWVGKLVRFQSAQGVTARRVAGVVADVRYDGRGSDAAATVYRPLESLTQLATVLVDASDGDARTEQVGRVLAAHGLRAPLMPVMDLVALEQQDSAIQRIRSTTVFATSGAGLVLGIVGLGWMLSVLVFKRLRELAVRSALGATDVRLLMLLLRQTSAAAVLAVATGAAAFELARRALHAGPASLHRLSAEDWAWCLGGVLMVCLLACVPPWRRLARLPLAQVLKSD